MDKVKIIDQTTAPAHTPPHVAKFLIFERDNDLAPTDIIADGDILTRLFVLESDDAPATMDFRGDEVDVLVAISSKLRQLPQLINTEGLKMLSGVRLLIDAYPSTNPESAAHQMEDLRHTRMQDAQDPTVELDRALKGLRTAMQEGKRAEVQAIDNEGPDDDETT
jgi:hypothetical protein